jgi:ketosteroid isomerase-like protein
MVGVNRAAVESWIAGYELAWRTPGTDSLAELFTPDVSYAQSPWGPVVYGLGALAEFWEANRVSADEPFSMRAGVVAVDGDTAVVRVEVDYAATGKRWRDIWIIELDHDGRCRAYEEWPFTPEQPDGHEP